MFKRRSAGWLMACAALVALTLAPAAQASGANSGGVNSGGGGSAGGGGGGGGGGAVSPTPTACSPIASLVITEGYYSVWAAAWTTFSLAPCSLASTGTWQLTFHNDNTGQVDYAPRGLYQLSSSGFSTVVDDDFGPFSTNYTVTLTVTDSSGVQTSRSATTTTRPPKTGP